MPMVKHYLLSFSFYMYLFLYMCVGACVLWYCGHEEVGRQRRRVISLLRDVGSRDQTQIDGLGIRHIYSLNSLTRPEHFQARYSGTCL